MPVPKVNAVQPLVSGHPRKADKMFEWSWWFIHYRYDPRKWLHVLEL